MNYWDVLFAKYLSKGGSSVEVEPLSVTENGKYTAQSGKAYSPVTVNVPQPSGSLPITENNTYDVTDYASVEVDVQITNPHITVKVTNSSGSTFAYRQIYNQYGTIMFRADTLNNNKSFTPAYGFLTYRYGNNIPAVYKFPLRDMNVNGTAETDYTVTQLVNCTLESDGTIKVTDNESSASCTVTVLHQV